MPDLKTEGGMIQQQPQSSTANSWDDGWDRWLQRHSDPIVATVLGAGLIARIWAAWGIFLNPDEAQHFLVANRTSLALAYRSTFTLAHPPLLIFVLYFWRHLGASELMLRLPSIVGGILFCWIYFKWLTLVLGRGSAFIGLVLVCLLPPLVSLTSEVRQYSFLLLFAILAAYWLEKSFANDSPRWMALSSISLYLAILSHYSAMLFAASIGVYVALRIASSRLQKSVVAVWILGQLGALALLTFLYRTHISKLRGSSMEQEASEKWLRHSYFHPGQDHILSFVVGRAIGVFQFIFGNPAIGDLMGVLFFCGVVLLIRLRNHTDKGEANIPKTWHVVVFFLLPFALNSFTALVGIYPFGGTRHSSFLVPFCLAGISFFLATIFGDRRARPLAAALLVVAGSILFGKPHHPFMTRPDQSRLVMQSSLDFIRQNVSQESPIMVDVQTRMLLTHYLCPQPQASAETSFHDFLVFNCGGYRVVTANTWLLDSQSFQYWWRKMVTDQGLPVGKKVWIVQEGWNIDVASELKSEISDYKNLEINSFGRDIQIFELTVKPNEL